MIIPGETEARLTQQIKNGEVVAFFGAGMAIPPGKDWGRLVEDIARECGVCIDSHDLKEIIDRCIEKDVARCNEVMRLHLTSDQPVTRTALVHASKLPFKAILTTNFDPWLRQSFDRKHFPSCFRYPDLPLNRGVEGGIYYLHGFFDSSDPSSSIEDLVFGARSFDRAYKESILSGFLLQVFTYEKILFIGFDPTEENVAGLISRSHRIRAQILRQTASHQPAERQNRHFALWAQPVSEPQEWAVREMQKVIEIGNLGLDAVLYERRSDDYRELEEVLRAWREKLSTVEMQTPPFSSGFG